MGKHKNSSSDKSSPKKAKKKKHAESVLSPFRVQQLELVVSLLPNCLSDIQHHISKNVNGLLMKFNEGADGVILSYTNIKFSNGEAVGRILDEQVRRYFSPGYLVFSTILACILRIAYCLLPPQTQAQLLIVKTFKSNSHNSISTINNLRRSLTCTSK